MEVPIPSFLDFLMVQLIKPFTFLVYMGVVIWWIENFYTTSLALIFSISFFWVLNYVLVRQGLKKIRDMI
jgi:hypothetical protein